jgi:MFS family permease
MVMERQVQNKNVMFYGWWVIGALLVIEMICPMGRYCMTTFFPFVTSELKWSRYLVSSAQTMALWVYALLVPFTGWMVDRIGSRKTFFLGGLFSLGGWILLSTMSTVWQLYIYYGLILGVAVSLNHMVTIQATANKWFSKRAGLVTGTTSAAFGIGLSIFMPLITNMANSFGWRVTSIIYGVGSGTVITILAMLVIRDSPESIGMTVPNENPAEISAKRSVSTANALKTSSFWLLFVAYSLTGIPLQGLWAHFVMWAVDIGTPKAEAGIFMSIMFLPSIVSKIGGGWLGDRLGKKKVLIISQLGCLLIMLWAWQYVNARDHLEIFAALFGLGYGVPMGLFAPFLADLFGREHVGALFGILTLGHGLMGGCGPLLWGYVSDTSGSYNPACMISAACYGAVTIALFLIPLTPAQIIHRSEGSERLSL